MSNILAKFMWLIARVDSRQYRQNSTELQPENFWIGVEIPLESDYIFNAEEIKIAKERKSLWELNPNQSDKNRPDDPPAPIYTAKALQFCLDKLGEYLRDPEPDDFKQENPDAEDWGDTSTEPTSVAGVDTETDWSDGASFDKDEHEKEVEKIWDEDKENWNE